MYDEYYYLGRECPEVQSYFKRMLRPGDQGAAVCYAFGYIDYKEVCRILALPLDDPRHLSDMEIEQQVKWILAGAHRYPGFVLDIGAGRGEIAAAFHLAGVCCIGIDPSEGSARLYRRTMKSWLGRDAYQFMNHTARVGLGQLVRNGMYPDTIILCEVLEHIVRAEWTKLLELIKWTLTQTAGLLIITNWIDNHPIQKESWDHVQVVDDRLYDTIVGSARRLILRQGSHLVVQF